MIATGIREVDLDHSGWVGPDRSLVDLDTVENTRASGVVRERLGQIDRLGWKIDVSVETFHGGKHDLNDWTGQIG